MGAKSTLTLTKAHTFITSLPSFLSPAILPSWLTSLLLLLSFIQPEPTALLGRCPAGACFCSPSCFPAVSRAVPSAGSTLLAAAGLACQAGLHILGTDTFLPLTTRTAPRGDARALWRGKRVPAVRLSPEWCLFKGGEFGALAGERKGGWRGEKGFGCSEQKRA